MTLRNEDYLRIEKAILYLGRSFRDRPDRQEVARRVNLSEYHFRSDAGISTAIFAGIGEVLDSFDPEAVAGEKGFVNVNPQSTLLPGQARGAPIAALTPPGRPGLSDQPQPPAVRHSPLPFRRGDFRALEFRLGLRLHRRLER